MDKVAASAMDTTKVQQTVLQVEALISQCGHADKAPWLAARRERLINGTPDEMHTALNELARVIAGMGSLSDLHLTPDATSGMTVVEANTRLSELLDDLYQEIKCLTGRTSFR